MKIAKISGRKILASLGNETVEATITLADGQTFTASVPAGISAGKYEIKKVTPDEAISQIGHISQICAQKDWSQGSLDAEISSHDFGGNATLAVSAAFWKFTNRLLLTANRFPKLMLLLFEGGVHGNPANAKLTIQEFMILEESVSKAQADFSKLKRHLEEEKIETLVGAEGGFSPENYDNEDAMQTINQVFPDKQICLDAADCFQKGVCPDYDQIIKSFPIASIEDPFSDEDWDKWGELYQKYAAKILIVGDDLTTTNPERIKMAIDKKAINAVVIKPNQIGTITKALEAVKIARGGGLKIVVSHRGEETDDTWIVDFALTAGADYVKFGGMDRGERIAKYNRLSELGMK